MYRRLPAPGTADYRRAEAVWKRNCSYTHQWFCGCPNYLLHFKCLGYQEVNGSAGTSATTTVVRGPLDGTTIKGPGSPDDVDTAMDAAVAFVLDDSG
ncbi:ORF2 [Gimeltorquevirus ursid13]|uniref:ORF2 n=1 Tax=Giant panda anellovirus TaxID=2016460 RepID=A0A220IGH4_9VIRU|nr:ORF2 [Giant panda anellovirus]ASH99093.1 ORF2 [Giant panda anellovirus]QZE11961.1 MAG: ORF2 [Giant panda anellovirus]